MPYPKVVIAVSRWEGTDYTVSVRPESAKPWQDAPIGPLVGEKEGERVAQWLRPAWPDIVKAVRAMDRPDDRVAALEQACRVARLAIRDAIRRPMGVEPDSATDALRLLDIVLGPPGLPVRDIP